MISPLQARLVDSRDVNRALRAQVRPCLREAGFATFTARTAWRHWELGVDVVNFQSFNSYLADGVGCTTFSFSVNLGIHLKYIPYLLGEERLKHKGEYVLPNEYECEIRRPLLKSLEQASLPRRDIWLIEADGNNIVAAVDDARNVIETEAFPWFQNYHDPHHFLELLLDSSKDAPANSTWGIGANPSPFRSYLTAYTARQLALHDQAVDQFEQVLASKAMPYAREQVERDLAALRLNSHPRR
jgi:hypothetical protein